MESSNLIINYLTNMCQTGPDTPTFGGALCTYCRPYQASSQSEPAPEPAPTPSTGCLFSLLSLWMNLN